MKSLIALMVTCAAGVALAQAPTPVAQATPAQSVPAARPSFTEWLDGVRTEALSRGIAPAIVDEALAGVSEPMPVVIERDRTQAETVLSLETYIRRHLSAARVRTGRAEMAQHKASLDKVADTYGVPAPIIAGIWGIESNFGRFTGVRPTVAALATLAWDPRRSTYFRGELFNALQILNSGDVPVAQFKGSWAGAMGQPQFMPSSYLQFAQDFDGDGRRDIWHSADDVMASIANYLKGHGWVRGQPWGREVKVPVDLARRIAGTVARRAGSCSATRDMTIALPVEEWRTLGVRTAAGGVLPATDLQASLVSGATRHFLVHPNYDALLDYNCANAYALSVALLGDQIASAPAAKQAISAPGPARRPARPNRRAPARSRTHGRR